MKGIQGWLLMFQGKDWLEETSWTLLTLSSPREAVGNDPHGFLC